MDADKREIRSLSDRVGSVAEHRDLKESETTKTSSKTGFLNKWRNDWACTQLDSLVVDRQIIAQTKKPQHFC